MMSFRLAMLCVGFLAVTFNNVEGVSEEDRLKMHAALLPTVQECSLKYSVTEQDIKSAKESGQIDKINKCLFACILKKTGIINDGGQFDLEKSNELVKKYISDAAEQSKAIEVLGKCASVNDQPASDEEGCDRAKLLFDCLEPYKKEFEPSR